MQERPAPIFRDPEGFMELVLMGYLQQGYDAELARDAELPLIVSVVYHLGEAEMAFNGMFLPLDFFTGDAVRIFHLYFTLLTDIPEKDFDRMEKICTHCNTNTALGTFCLQRKIGALSYKLGLPLRNAYGNEAPLAQVLDSTILMRTMVEAFYPSIALALQKGLSLEELIAMGHIPTGNPLG